MSYSTLSAILKGKWLIDPSAAKSYLPIVANVLKGNTLFEEKEPELGIVIYELPKDNKVAFIGGGGIGKVLASHTIKISRQWQLDEATIKPNSTVVVPVSGPMMKNDQFCGPVGMMSLASITKQLSEHHNVDAIIFDIDSPGGQVDGTQTFAEAIKSSSKKTIALVNDGMACSAAYWIGSSCDEFYVSKRTDVVGSIGVYCTLADFKAWYEAEGLPIHEIYAPQSTEKNKDYRDAMKGEYGAVQDDLKFLADEFITAVKANRPALNLSKGDPFKGATYYAEQAMEIGLIDGIKSMDEILGMIKGDNQATEESTESHAENDNNNTMIKELTAIKGKAAADISADEITSINAAIQAEGIEGVEVVQAGTVEDLRASAGLNAEEKNELEQLRAWKKESGQHTAGAAKPDSFNEPENEESAEAILAREQKVLEDEYGI